MQHCIQDFEASSFVLIQKDFEFELFLHMHIMKEVVDILAPFLSFASIYNALKAHNMILLHSFKPTFKKY